MRTRAVVIGGGNMAEAIIAGALEAGVIHPAHWTVVDPNEERRAVFEAWGLATEADAHHALGALEDHAELWLAIKPQVFDAVASGWPDAGPRTVVSIMAGVPTDALRRRLGAGIRAVRVMPNTPVRVRTGVSAIALGEGSVEEDAALSRRVFGALGTVVELHEDLIDAFTGVAGSGPAYLYMVAEAMIRGAVEAGISAADADTIVRALFRGASELMATSERSPGELRVAVTSPGGTTAAGLDVLRERGVEEAFVRAIEAARDRGRALGHGPDG
ncbi:MAG: pyrroline-5-carboxylate reductase [Phycisphaerales bacterium]